jgi:hypothetical protein
MLEKYVEERFPRWMLMGYHGTTESPDDNLTNANDEFNLRLRADTSQQVVQMHNDLLAKFAKMADAFDKADHAAFQKFWYCGGLE